jgi:tetratricopeptide (TPR) repeat protein
MSRSIEHKLAFILWQGVLTVALSGVANAATYPTTPNTYPATYPATTGIYPATTAPLTLMQKGQQHMTAGQYSKAEECFRQSAVEHPRDASVHYYLANVLVYEKKHPQAIEEYSQAFRLDPYGPLSGYCRKALVTYRLHAPAVVPEPDSGFIEPISAAERLGLRLPETGDKGAMVQLIRTQVEREKSRHRHYAESIAATIVRSGETRAQQIERNAHDAINDALNAPLRIRPFENPFAAAERQRVQIEQMRKEAEEAAKFERASASEKSDGYKRIAMEHEFSLDETASNLEGQLLSKVLPGSAHLHPEGTGLFVRYYGRTGDVDVHNSVAHFTDNHAFESADEDEAQDESESGKMLRKLSNDRPLQVRESTVRGAVLK